mmetsp:Transcript_43084/g.122110  ORF Transcript_43084/g.122110 Transcript_43084/m.122110 type:complete len:217 (+) Transcript_43084:1534-2184(+)
MRPIVLVGVDVLGGSGGAPFGRRQSEQIPPAIRPIVTSVVAMWPDALDTHVRWARRQIQGVACPWGRHVNGRQRRGQQQRHVLGGRKAFSVPFVAGVVVHHPAEPTSLDAGNGVYRRSGSQTIAAGAAGCVDGERQAHRTRRPQQHHTHLPLTLRSSANSSRAAPRKWEAGLLANRSGSFAARSAQRRHHRRQIYGQISHKAPCSRRQKRSSPFFE